MYTKNDWSSLNYAYYIQNANICELLSGHFGHLSTPDTFNHQNISEAADIKWEDYKLDGHFLNPYEWSSNPLIV